MMPTTAAGVPQVRTLDLNIISATDLKSVNLFSRMSVYAVVSLSGDPRVQQRTPPDREGGRNPTWNSSLRLSVPAVPDPSGRPCFLLIALRTERRLFGDRSVGEVRVPLRDLLSGAPVDGPKPAQTVSYQVRRVVSGKVKGVLTFSYSLGQRVGRPPPAAAAAFVPPAKVYPPPPAAAAFVPPAEVYPPPQGNPKKGEEEPVMAYPVGATSSAQPPPYGYAPAPRQHGQGYAYPPAPAGYGYPPVVAQPRRNNMLGMGLGAGLLGGALGGLLIGDMVSDAAAYDAGFDDGFDF